VQHYEDLKCRIALRRYNFPGNYERVYFYHIRKTGGTSLNHMFLALGGEDPEVVYDRVSNGPYFGTVSGGIVFAGWNHKLVERGRYFYAFSHIPFHRLRLPANTYTITCVRDPVKRVLSLYNMLYTYMIEEVDHPGMVIQRHWLGESFSDFMELAPREEILNQIFFFSKSLSIDEAIENALKCDHIIFTENFVSGIEKLNGALNLTLKPVHNRKGGQQPVVTNDELASLVEYLEPEFKFYKAIKKEGN
jgi:hypothetical protein